MAGGGCMQLLNGDSYYTNRTNNKRNRVNSNSARKIRVMCYDPDATDSSSSDEEDSTSGLRKRIVQEINLPLSSIPSAAVSSSFQDSNSPISPTRGKWVWLGAYDELTKMEFDGLAESNKGSCSVDSTNSVMDGPHDETQMLDFVSVEEPFECIDLQMDLDSLFVNDYGQVFDDLTLFNHLPICEFDGLHPSIDLPGFDFELGNDELAWIDTTPL